MPSRVSDIYFKIRSYFEAIPFKTFSSFIGPGFMVAVGYLDPGNWATDISAGSEFGYKLLFVILMANIMAIALQYLCIKLGVITHRDLAENCKAHMHPYVNIFFYILCELAIMATDLAEVIGTAIALKLLFGLPLPWGIVLTGLDVLIILLGFKAKYLRYFELFIGLLVLTVAICFAILLTRVGPDWSQVAAGYLPIVTIFGDPSALYLAMGIIGATVMPHNLYLHSNMVKYRSSPDESALGKILNVEENPPALKSMDLGIDEGENRNLGRIIKFMNWDSMLALWFALLINSAILIVAAAAFHNQGKTEVGELEEAFNLLSQSLGTSAGIIFAVALFCSGQSSTITGTLAGQIVMQGFLGDRFKMPAWLRRLITRSVAIVPALIVSLAVGDKGVNQLLILSQVILSLQLPFAVWPLVIFTSSKEIMSIQVLSQTSSQVSTEPFIETDSEDVPLDSMQNDETQDIVATSDFSNSVPLKVFVFGIALLLTGLNIFLLTRVNEGFHGK